MLSRRSASSQAANTEVRCDFRNERQSTRESAGKVLVELIKDEEVPATQPRTVQAQARAVCHPRHVYVVTGGLGGFGIEFVHWLIDRGARKLVLCSRSGVRTAYQSRCMYFWRRTGVKIQVRKVNTAKQAMCRVQIATSDITTAAGAYRVIKEAQEQLDGPIGGIFHLATVLRDTVFETQEAKNFREVERAKKFATMYLDRATRKLCDPKLLKWYISCSALPVECTFPTGSSPSPPCRPLAVIAVKHPTDGQMPAWSASLRGGAPMVLARSPCSGVLWRMLVRDVICICRERAQMAGIFIRNVGNNDTIVAGYAPQRLSSCLAAIDMFMCLDDCSAFFSAVVSCGKREIIFKFNTFQVHQRELAASQGGSADLMSAVARILGVGDPSSLAPDATLGDLGLDSLMGVEVKQMLERNFDLVLSMRDIRLVRHLFFTFKKTRRNASVDNEQTESDRRRRLVDA